MTKERTFALVIERREDGYLAYFPSLLGCQTWGATYEGAVRNAEDALALHLETLEEHGDPIPEETTQEPVSLSVTVRSSMIV